MWNRNISGGFGREPPKKKEIRSLQLLRFQLIPEVEKGTPWHQTYQSVIPLPPFWDLRSSRHFHFICARWVAGRRAPRASRKSAQNASCGSKHTLQRRRIKSQRKESAIAAGERRSIKTRLRVTMMYCNIIMHRPFRLMICFAPSVVRFIACAR